MRTRLAWGLAALTGICVVADGVMISRYLPLTSEAAVAMQGFPFIPGAVLGCSVMGALVVTRYPRHVVGWLLNLLGTLGSLSIVLEGYSIWVDTHDGPGSPMTAAYAGWLSTLFGGQIALMGISLLFLLVPDGHLVSRRWRYAVPVPALGGLLCFVGVAATDPRSYSLTAEAGLAETGNGLAFDAGLVLIMAGLFVSLVGLVTRLLSSQGELRRQLRLITLSAACVCVGLIWSVVGEVLNGGQQTWSTSLPLFTAYLLMPVLFAIAVLRYRLYDIEVIINRTLMVAAGTAFAAVGYTALVVGAGEVAGRVSGQLWFSLTATMVVALAFQPARLVLLRLSQRLAFGPRAQPYEALSDFSSRLAQLPSPDSLLATVAEAAAHAVGASRAMAGLHPLRPDAPVATWGAGGPSDEPEHEVPVRARGDVIGRLAVTMPRGRPLQPSDLRLLEALADQAGIAFRNAAMQAELTRHVAALARTTEDLESSRSRIVEADDAVRRDLSAAISGQVLPHLHVVGEALGERSSRAGGPTTTTTTLDPTALEPLVLRVNAALAALRELTRGVHPTQLSRLGLEPALCSLLDRAGLPVVLDVEPAASVRRFAARVEAAVYFCCVGAVAPGSQVTRIAIRVAGDELVHTVEGHRPSGIDLTAVRDQAGAAGGRVETGAGVVLRFRVEANGSAPGHPLTSRQT